MNILEELIILKEEKTIENITNARDIFNNILKININYNKEHFIVFTLNTKNKIIGSHIITIGTLNENLIHPREIFIEAIKDCANSIIISHNHPSNDLTPSDADIIITKKLLDASNIIGIKILDHIIFNKTQYYSLNANKELYSIDF